MGRTPGVVCSASVVLALTGCAAAGNTPVATPGVSPAAQTGSTGVAAPGPSATDVGVDEAFKAKANAACRPYSDYNTANPFPFNGFDPDHPDPALLPQIGDFFDRNPINHTLIPTLAALGEPARGSTQWHTLLDDLGHGAQLATEQIAEARATDVAGFVANVAQSRRQFATVNQAFAAAGFAIATDFCAALYGG